MHSLHAAAAVRTLSEVGGGTDWNDGVVECRNVRRREMCVTALTLFDHVALVARLLACLSRRTHSDTYKQPTVIFKSSVL